MSMRVATANKTSETTTRNQGFKTNTTGFSQPSASPVNGIVFLHQTLGNQTVQRLFKSGKIQAALKIGQPSDAYEKEADRVADQVLRMSNEAVSNRQSAVSRENESAIQMKPG
jgi:hypothetical protein